MLKGFVSGEEKDIKRIPMKGKNLLNESASSDADATHINYNKGAPVILTAGQAYTFSCNTACNGLYIRGTDDSSLASANNSSTLTYTPQANISAYFRIWNNNGITNLNPMFNLGSAPLPYEPYGYQEGWEVRDNQDRLIWGREDELQTATGTLPFKGYALPLKVKSLLGNAVQNGTPAPDNIITPEMCGVRTAQMIPYPYELPTTETSGVTFSVDSDGRITATGRTTANLTALIRRNIGMLTAGTYTFSVTGKHEGLILYVRDMVAQATIANILSGSTSTSTTFTLAENTSNEIRVYMTRAAGYDVDFDCTVQLEKGSTATEHEPYGWKVPFENHGENLFDKNHLTYGFLNTDGSIISHDNFVLSDYLPLDNGLSFSATFDGTITIIYALYDSSHNYVSGSRTVKSVSSFSIPAQNGVYALINFSSATADMSTVMLNLGSIPKPYSPYLNTTIPVYLGEVPTVRRVKKLVLDGTESWTMSVLGGHNGFLTYAPHTQIGSTNCVCSHYKSKYANANNTIYFIVQPINGRFVIFDDRFSSSDDFKAYLVQQYQNGTPVTIWYVLANEQTGISNEPLCKISTYADELTTIGVHGLSAPLYGIGDYKDTLNLSTGVITRKIKKLVLTGEENIEIKSGNAKWYIPIADMKTPDNFGVIDWYCSHYQAVSNSATWTSYDYMISWPTVDSGLSIGLRIRDIDFLTSTTAAEFQSYLAAQYQAGTPVTIWYVLSTPTTETVTVPTGMTGEIEGYLTQVSTPTPTNRSVPKWNGEEETGGTYAVTVYTPPEIPTTTGQNTLTVETETITVPYGLECSIEGYLTQSSTPSPSSPITPDSNGILESGGTYAVEVSLVPSSLTVKGHIKELT